MTVVALFVGLGVLLVLSGVWGRRNTAGLARVPGMPQEHVEQRATVMRRGATVCVLVGIVLLVVGVFAPFI